MHMKVGERITEEDVRRFLTMRLSIPAEHLEYSYVFPQDRVYLTCEAVRIWSGKLLYLPDPRNFTFGSMVNQLTMS